MEQKQNVFTNTPINNPYQITDLIFGNLIFSKFGDILKDGFELSPKNIIKILMILSLTELKELIKQLILYLIKLFKPSPLAMYNMVTKFIEEKRIYGKRLIMPAQKLNDYKINSRKIVFLIDVNYIMSFYNYLKNNGSHCTFTTVLSQIEIKNSKEYIFIERISNVKINFRELEILTSDIIEMGINRMSKEGVSFCLINGGAAQTQPSCYLNLLTAEQSAIIQKIVDELLNSFNNYRGIISYMDKNIKNLTIRKEICFTEHAIADLLVEKYNFDKDRTLVEITVLSCIIYKYWAIASISKALTELKCSNRMIFDFNSSYLFTENYESVDAYTNNFSDEIIAIIKRLELAEKTQKQFDIYRNYGSNRPKIESNNTLTFTIFSHIIDKLDLNKLMEDFTKEIYKNARLNNRKVRISYVQLVGEAKIEEIANPEYEAWNEKKQLVQNIKKDTIPVEFITFLNEPVPSKMLRKEIHAKKIVSKQLNEIEKDIDTLYLRKKDKDKLLVCLSQFRDKKQILKSLGLQNKLNILLYGEPGTGKSTTIQAIATYLQKDIYYVDLKEAVLNQDLQLIFEYVNKNVPNGGIIVMEDIDAMTDVVLRRDERTENTKEYTVNNIINNQNSKLTLEYFLNILQGTLTIEDSVYVVTTNHIERLDPAFYRDGRIDVKIKLKLCDHYQIKMMYEKILGREILPVVLEKIPKNKFTPATVIYHVKDYIFSSETKDEIIMKKFMIP